MIEKREFAALLSINLRDRLERLIEAKVEKASDWMFQSQIRYYVEFSDQESSKPQNKSNKSKKRDQAIFENERNSANQKQNKKESFDQEQTKMKMQERY